MRRVNSTEANKSRAPQATQQHFRRYGRLRCGLRWVYYAVLCSAVLRVIYWVWSVQTKLIDADSQSCHTFAGRSSCEADKVNHNRIDEGNLILELPSTVLLRDAIYMDGALHVYSTGFAEVSRELSMRQSAGQFGWAPPWHMCIYLAEREANITRGSKEDEQLLRDWNGTQHAAAASSSAPTHNSSSRGCSGVDGVRGVGKCAACPHIFAANHTRGATLYVQNAIGTPTMREVGGGVHWPYAAVRVIDSPERWAALKASDRCAEAEHIPDAVIVGARYNCAGPWGHSSFSEWMNEVFLPTFKQSYDLRGAETYPLLMFHKTCTFGRNETNTRLRNGGHGMLEWSSGWSLDIIPWHEGALRVLPEVLTGSLDGRIKPQSCVWMGRVRLGMSKLTSWYSYNTRTKQLSDAGGRSMGQLEYMQMLRMLRAAVSVQLTLVTWDSAAAKESADWQTLHSGWLAAARHLLHAQLPLVREREQSGARGEVAPPASEIASPASEIASPASEIAPPASEIASPALWMRRGRSPAVWSAACSSLAPQTSRRLSEAYPWRRLLWLRREGRRGITQEAADHLTAAALDVRVEVRELRFNKTLHNLDRELEDAEIIFFVHGADAANLVLMRPCTVVVQLCPCGYGKNGAIGEQCRSHYYGSMTMLAGGLYYGVNNSWDDDPSVRAHCASRASWVTSMMHISAALIGKMMRRARYLADVLAPRGAAHQPKDGTQRSLTRDACPLDLRFGDDPDGGSPLVGEVTMQQCRSRG